MHSMSLRGPGGDTKILGSTNPAQTLIPTDSSQLDPCSPSLQNHRMVKVGKDLQDVQAQPQPIPLCPLTTSLSATSPWLWNSFRDSDHTTPWAAVPVHYCSFGEERFPNIQPEHPLVQHEAVISHPTEAPGLGLQWVGITFPRHHSKSPLETYQHRLIGPDLSTATFSASNKTINPIIKPSKTVPLPHSSPRGLSPPPPTPQPALRSPKYTPGPGQPGGGRGSGAPIAHAEHLPSASRRTASSHVHTARSYGSGNGEGKVRPWIEKKKSAFVHQVCSNSILQGDNSKVEGLLLLQSDSKTSP